MILTSSGVSQKQTLQQAGYGLLPGQFDSVVWLGIGGNELQLSMLGMQEHTFIVISHIDMLLLHNNRVIVNKRSFNGESSDWDT